jgi:hypothetical protein
MARHAKLEARVDSTLRDEPGKTQKAMFGGVAWLIAGHLLCAAPGASEATRKTLIAAALAFVRAMPAKPKPKRPPRRAGEAIRARGGARR